MNILMLGWEFPPYISGGLGTACKGLTEAMKRLKTRVTFVLPRSLDPLEEGIESETGREDPGVDPAEEILPLSKASEEDEPFGDIPVPSRLTSPYHEMRPLTEKNPHPLPGSIPQKQKAISPAAAKHPSVRVMGVGAEDGYDGDLIWKINDYAERCTNVACNETFDLIHAHDWITFPAGLRIARLSGKPLVTHVHATEFDRSGENINRAVYEIEKMGVERADRVVAVSYRTRQILIDRYGATPYKVEVIHNGIEQSRTNGAACFPRPEIKQKTVLFLGRITMQKGPEYFVRAAARVAERFANVRFVMAGKGDLLPRAIELSEELGIRDRMEFPGFLSGEEVDRAYRDADVYVMPSVSEPFGLTPLEAIRNHVPVIVSKSSGVAEVLPRGSLKVDYWDVELMARLIVNVLRTPQFAGMIRQHAAEELQALTWDRAARRCRDLYTQYIRTPFPESRSVRTDPEQMSVRTQIND